MCDYSLMTFPNRLAQDGETLVTHRFQTGCIGLVSPSELKPAVMPVPVARQSLWARVKEFFDPPRRPSVCAVCIPPGARLRLQGISQRLQIELGVSACENVTFTQLTAAANTYRDAVRFNQGREVRLQELSEGQHVTVLDLSGADELDLEKLRRERREFSLAD